MKKVIFYEKPGCKGNARQKALLEEAGFELEVRSLPDTAWTAEELRLFFGARPVSEWFNRTAPAVKSGEIDPDAMDEAAALAAMVANPLLVRRPLLVYNGKKVCGFDNYVQHEVLGLAVPAEGYEKCQSVAKSERCD